MGVKTLWPVLEEAVDSTDKNIPVKSLQGKRVAVDLSSWIVEFQTIKTKTTTKNLYLRNLYYRTTELLGYGIKLIFVADGTAPDMKAAVMKKRQEAQFGTASSSIDTGRTRFRADIEKCKELLKFLGVPLLYSDGEGEALCAALNADGRVDGVMTSDVDAFLYGATTVYRSRDYRTNSGVPVVDIYKMDNIQKELGLDQRALVVVALLVGCDFCQKGLGGVGIEKAQALIRHLKKLGQDPLDRLCGWRNNRELQDLDKVTKSKHCSNCEHEGEKSSHKLRGCGYCGTSISCTSHKPTTDTATPPTQPCQCSWHQRKDHELELRIWTKAMEDKSFPNQEIIKEFLGAHQQLESPDLTFHTIDVRGVKNFMTRYFPSMYSESGKFYSDFAAVLVQLQLHDMTDDFLTSSTTLTPLTIVQTRKRQSVPHLEVRWSKLDEDKETTDNFYIVISETSCFQDKFPDITAEYFEEKQSKKGVKKSGVKRKAVDPGGNSSQCRLTNFFKTKKK